MRATVKVRFKGAAVEIELEGKTLDHLIEQIEHAVGKLKARETLRGEPVEPITRSELESLFSLSLDAKAPEGRDPRRPSGSNLET